MKRSFSRAVIHNKALSKDKEDLMVIFMLSNIKEIFKVRKSTVNTVYLFFYMDITLTHNISQLFLKGEDLTTGLCPESLPIYSRCPLLHCSVRKYRVPG